MVRICGADMNTVSYSVLPRASLPQLEKGTILLGAESGTSPLKEHAAHSPIHPAPTTVLGTQDLLFCVPISHVWYRLIRSELVTLTTEGIETISWCI